MRYFPLRHVFLGLFISLNMLTFCWAQTTCAQDSSSPASIPAIGKIVWVKGTVKALGPDQKERVLQRSSAVYEKDTVMTDKTSTGQIVFTDNSMVSLNADTAFRVDQYKFDRNNSTAADGKYVANLAKGGFRTVTGLIPKGHPDNYQVNTPVATIGIRGTDYQVAINNGSLYLKLYKGAILVQNESGSLELNELKRKLYAVVGAHQAPVLLDKAPAFMKTELPITSVPATSAPGKGRTTDSFCIQ